LGCRPPRRGNRQSGPWIVVVVFHALPHSTSVGCDVALIVAGGDLSADRPSFAEVAARPRPPMAGSQPPPWGGQWAAGRSSFGVPGSSSAEPCRSRQHPSFSAFTGTSAAGSGDPEVLPVCECAARVCSAGSVPAPIPVARPYADCSQQPQFAPPAFLRRRCCRLNLWGLF
jgi:hypothetical protein